MEDPDEVVDGWPKRRGPGYFAVVLLSILSSALVVVGAQVALARWPGLQSALGGGRDSPDRARVEVPAVTKLPLDAASGFLAANGLKLLSIGSAADPEVPPGYVMTQSPAAGTKVRRGRTVQVKLSSGPPQVAVPPVVGAGLAEAQHALEQAGLRIGSVETPGALFRVKAARPAPGEQATTGSPVTLVLEAVGPPDAGAPEDPDPPRRRR